MKKSLIMKTMSVAIMIIAVRNLFAGIETTSVTLTMNADPIYEAIEIVDVKATNNTAKIIEGTNTLTGLIETNTSDITDLESNKADTSYVDTAEGDANTYTDDSITGLKADDNYWTGSNQFDEIYLKYSTLQYVAIETNYKSISSVTYDFPNTSVGTVTVDYPHATYAMNITGSGGGHTYGLELYTANSILDIDSHTLMLIAENPENVLQNLITWTGDGATITSEPYSIGGKPCLILTCTVGAGTLDTGWSVTNNIIQSAYNGDGIVFLYNEVSLSSYDEILIGEWVDFYEMTNEVVNTDEIVWNCYDYGNGDGGTLTYNLTNYVGSSFGLGWVEGYHNLGLSLTNILQRLDTLETP